jgi:hypothetical protein
MTPVLLARRQRRAKVGRTGPSMKKMALGALIVVPAYLLLIALCGPAAASIEK